MTAIAARDILDSQLRHSLSVAVVICAYTEDRWDDILDAVASCHAQTLAPSEVVVVVDHNPALARRLVASLPEIKVVENEESPGLSGARNTGIGATTSQIVAFLDDDAKARPDWIEGLVNAYGAPDVAAVGGHAQPGWPDHAPPSWFPAEFGWVVGCSYTGQPSTLATVRNPIGCNMSFRREIFELVGLFSSSIGRVGKRPVGCEETELCLRLKQALPQSRVLYDPSLVVDHRVTTDRATPRYFFRRCWSEGISKAIVATLAGTEEGLSSERDYVTGVLPRGVARNLREAVRRRDLHAARRAAIIVGGLATTTAGYGYGLASSERRRAVQSQRNPARPRKVMTLDLDDPLPAITSVRVGAAPVCPWCAYLPSNLVSQSARSNFHSLASG